MRVGLLACAVKIASKVVNPSSFSPIHRCIELGPNCVRACSEYGTIQIPVETELSEPALLDCVAVGAVIRSLGQYEEVYLHSEGNRVYWSNDNAHGHWDVVKEDNQIPAISHSSFPWKPPDSFADALLLASSAVDAASVSIGIYGLVIERRGKLLRLVSSNSISLALAVVPGEGYPTRDRITIRPPIPSILASLLRLYPDLMLDVTRDGIFVEDDQVCCQLPLSPPLDHDLFAVADRFSTKKITAEIDPAAVKRFLLRAKALTNRHMSSVVELRIEAGNLILLHKAFTSRTEEYLLADGIDPSASLAPLLLPIELMTVPLEHVDTVVLDHLPQGVLVLQREHPTFEYVLG